MGRVEVLSGPERRRRWSAEQKRLRGGRNLRGHLQGVQGCRLVIDPDGAVVPPVQRNAAMKWIVAILPMLALPAQAAQIHVSTGGSDVSGCGAQLGPCATIDFATNNVAQPGDEVIVHAGTYAPVYIGANGNTNALIWVHAAPEEAVLIDGSSITGDQSLVTVYGRFIRFEGFEVANNAIDGGFYIVGSDNQIVNNNVHDCQTTGINADVGSLRTWIGGNTVYFCSKQNQFPPHRRWAGGITMYAPYSVASNNTVYNNWGEGLDAYDGCYSCRIMDNTLWDNYAVNIYVDSSSKVEVAYNVGYCTGDPRFNYDASGKLPNGISTAQEVSGKFIDGNVFHHNLDVGCRRGFNFWDESGYGGLTNAQIYNNTWVNENHRNIEIAPSATGNGFITMHHNIAYNVTGANLAAGSNGGVTSDHNTWFDGAQNNGSPFGGSGDVPLDPMLVAPNATFQAGTLNVANYHLRPGSPAAGMGAFPVPGQ
jgi:hypothetical protein